MRRENSARRLSLVCRCRSLVSRSVALQRVDLLIIIGQVRLSLTRLYRSAETGILGKKMLLQDDCQLFEKRLQSAVLEELKARYALADVG